MTTVTLFFVHVNNVNMLWQKIYHKILLTHPRYIWTKDKFDGPIFQGTYWEEKTSIFYLLNLFQIKTYFFFPDFVIHMHTELPQVRS